jgi:1-acyl-sn-glycerol-3-phosphate acyltransferase
MNSLRAIYRLLWLMGILLAGTVAILLLSWLPLKRDGVRLAAWPVRWMADRFLGVCAISIEPPGAVFLRDHRGFVFPNHQSFVDAILLASVLPVRFLAKQEVKRYPLIGWVAQAIGTIFVDRGNRDSRRRAREKLAQTPLYPPIVIFPEGMIPAQPGLQPFRHGAFEIAIQNGTPVLPCAIIYDRPDVVHWGDESLLAVLWRVAGQPGTIRAQLLPLPLLRPDKTDLAELLALQTHEALAATLASAAF